MGVGLGVNVGVAVGAGVTVLVGVGKGGYTKELTCKVAPATSCAVEPSGICLLTQIGHNSPSPAIFGLFSKVPIFTGVFAGARKNCGPEGAVNPSVAPGIVLIGEPGVTLVADMATPIVFVVVIIL